MNVQREVLELPANAGMTIAIEIQPRGAIDYKTFEWKRDGIEVLTVAEGEGSDVIALYVPDGKIAVLEKRVQEYLEKNYRETTKPAHANLVNAIRNITRAAFTQLWTDVNPPPSGNDLVWYQIWIRQGNMSPRDAKARFVEHANRLGIEIESGHVSFPGRVVVAALATREMLEVASQLLDMVAEIREVAPTAEFYLADLKPMEQTQWVENLIGRTQHADNEAAAYVTLLDTGVNNGHPLLSGALDPADMHSVDPSWGTHDHQGHGTEMAGLALYGNLVGPLSSNESLSILHRLESVKILPPSGQNAPHLYGSITRIAATQVEVEFPDRRRTFAMMTTATGKSTGEPSEWSATLDQLAFGRAAVDVDDQSEDIDPSDDEPELRHERLFVLAAGNVAWDEWKNYPNINALSPIENPAQAWNAISVGATTTLTEIDSATYPSLGAIAPSGGLGPSSRTSELWARAWPYKPDVVAEGGNGSIEHGLHVSVGPASLRLLTTSSEPLEELLAESGDTSAAAAEVARLCANLSARYPEYWMETIRALVIHGARYSSMMRGMLPLVPRKLDKLRLLRNFGYGVVGHDYSQYSEALRPTLVIQNEFQPYRLDGSAVKLGQLQFHDLPWPREDLLAMDAELELRITLSYFVEPNPARRGWQSKFRYQSHALRFAVRGATESEAAFMARVNKLERDVDSDETYSDADSNSWTMGAQLRARGSIHSDVWTGTSAELATKSQIAVFPVGGWWKDWKEAGRYDNSIRYSLVVSLEVKEGTDIDVDLYGAIAAKIGVPIVEIGPVPIEIAVAP